MTSKLSPKQRDEVNMLIGKSQDDLEGVLFDLIAARDDARAHAEKLRAQNKKLRGALSINSNFWNKSESTADGAALVESMRKVCAHALENTKISNGGTPAQ